MKNNLRHYRQQIPGLTQSKLAQIVGISETHYQKLEYGQTVPNTYLAQKLASALNSTVDELFPLEENA